MKLISSIAAISALFLSANVQAQIIPDDWTSADTAREAVFVSLWVADYKQTTDIKNHPDLHETNPLLGLHPSDSKIRNYFLGVGIAHVLISRTLPAGWPRQTYAYARIAMEVAYVVKNKRLGMQIKF